jgi:transcriptional regulator with XRE-family HTH domain
MNAYQSALQRFLATTGMKQEEMAARIDRPQPTLNRYARGKRFPDAETARRIHDATNGAVPFELWQSVAAEKFLGEAA